MERLTPVQQLPRAAALGLRGILCDIDDTLTTDGLLVPAAFLALHRAREAGLSIIPVTGRPAGWVDHIARMWPVDGVVGENGGLWFFMDDGRMRRRFAQSAQARAQHRRRLDELATSILAAVPGTALASDQPYRELDLAVDFCEDVAPLDDDAIERIELAFRSAGATCRASSIHVNGWFGHYDKLSGCAALLAERFDTTADEAANSWLYVGDSANDEPMFAHFANSVGVANVRRFLPRMTSWPRYITTAQGGEGFAEAIDHILALRGQAPTM